MDHYVVREDHTPCRDLWASVVVQLIDDARRIWEGKSLYAGSGTGCSENDAYSAWADLIDCGPMTQYCASMAGFQPEYVSRLFIEWCEANP